jgi:transposase
MPNGMRWVGLDVHAHVSAVAVLDDVAGKVIAPGLRPAVGSARGAARASALRAVYEAGPTGYGLVRRARAEGIEIVVGSRATSSAARAVGSRPTSATRSG